MRHVEAPNGRLFYRQVLPPGFAGACHRCVVRYRIPAESRKAAETFVALMSAAVDAVVRDPRLGIRQGRRGFGATRRHVVGCEGGWPLARLSWRTRAAAFLRERKARLAAETLVEFEGLHPTIV